MVYLLTSNYESEKNTTFLDWRGRDRKSSALDDGGEDESNSNSGEA